MTSYAAQSVSNYYYFDPLTQKYSEDYQESCISIKLTTPKELPLEKLHEVIQRLGNYIAVKSVKHRSKDTETNYCTDYTKHASTCVQAYWNYCKRHLTEQEMNECSELEKRLDPLLLNGVDYEIHFFYISRGDIDLMRRILSCVRAAIQ